MVFISMLIDEGVMAQFFLIRRKVRSDLIGQVIAFLIFLDSFHIRCKFTIDLSSIVRLMGRTSKSKIAVQDPYNHHSEKCHSGQSRINRTKHILSNRPR